MSRRRDANLFAPYLYEPYRSTLKRAPTKPPLRLPQTISEITGPGSVASLKLGDDNDLTRNAQTGGEALGNQKAGPESGRFFVSPLLQDPSVAIGIAEVRKRAVVGVLGIGTRHPLPAGDVADVADFYAAPDELGTRIFDVGDH